MEYRPGREVRFFYGIGTGHAQAREHPVGGIDPGSFGLCAWDWQKLRPRRCGAEVWGRERRYTRCSTQPAAETAGGGHLCGARCHIHVLAEGLVTVQLTDHELARVLEQSNGAVAITDLDGIIRFVNEKFAQVTGYTADEAIGNTPSVLSCGKTPPEVYVEMWETIRTGNIWEGRVLNKRKATLPMRLAGGDPRVAKNEYWAHLSITPIRDAEGNITMFAANQRDVTLEVEAERRLEFERSEGRVRADIAMALQGKDPLRARIAWAFELLMGLEELEIENKCGIFLRNEAKTHLDMFITHGEFSEEFLEREQQIPYGACLCGKAIVSGDMLISDDCFCDPRHEHTFVGMKRHGHYIVPLRAFGDTIGIMFLYTAPFPARDDYRIRTMHSVGDSIALAIAKDQIERQLVEATERANEASHAKSDFLANMSHEIRTPLNGILGFTDMLRRNSDTVNEAERKEWLDVIHDSGQHLLQLINNILDLSKVEADKLDVECASCKPMDILSDVVSVMRVQATEKDISLDIECIGRTPRTITSDPTRLRQIMTNLVGNAIKFTPGGSVRIRTRVKELEDRTANLVIDVVDTGPGIPEYKLDSIFNAFSQADTSITRKYGGTGLGLPISRRLAEALGGSLEVSSVVGQGSTFTLALALGPIESLDLTKTFSREVVREADSSGVAGEGIVRLAGHVLLVDDGETNRRLIELLLTRVGVEVTTADNGQKALALATRTAYDLILMDMQMPIMDGYTASQQIREHGVTTPIIALTASAMKGDRERCLEAGCDDYLTKPVEIEALLGAASKWLTAPSVDDTECAGSEVFEAQSAEGMEHETPAYTGISGVASSLPTDDPEFLQIVLDYIDKLSDQVSAMERSCEEQDFENLARLAHWLRGSGGTAGFDLLTFPAERLEQAALDQLDNGAAAVIDELKALTEKIQQGVQTPKAREHNTHE